jgi:hypothetical protein
VIKIRLSAIRSQDVNALNMLINNLLQHFEGPSFIEMSKSRITHRNIERFCIFLRHRKKIKDRKSAIYDLLIFFEMRLSGEYRSRTDDLLHAMQAL